MSFRDSVGTEAHLLFLEIVHQPYAWMTLASIVCTYIKMKHGRILTIKQGEKATKIEGITEKELSKLLNSADSLTIETREDNS